MEEWKNGRMEEWKGGRMEGWKNGIRTLDAADLLICAALGAPGPSAPPNPMGQRFCCDGCKGLQPSKAITAIGTLNEP